MILRSKPHFKDIIFAVNGSILPRIASHLLAIAFISIIAIFAALEHPGIFARISAIPFTLIGIALSVFMSFRNSACYTRWLEGRQLWGELIIACRSFAPDLYLGGAGSAVPSSRSVRFHYRAYSALAESGRTASD
jgi:putative membrane protein